MMTVNPGFAGQKFNYSVIDKLKKMTVLLNGYDNLPFIEVDGNINKQTMTAMFGNKVDIYVLGTSALFNDKDDRSYAEKIQELRSIVVESYIVR